LQIRQEGIDDPAAAARGAGPLAGLAAAAATLSRLSSLLAGFVLIGITGFTLWEIARRAVFGTSSNVLVEFVGYGLAAMTFLGASQTMRAGDLVRVNVLLQFTPPGMRRALDAFCLACGLAVVGFAGWFVFQDMLRSWVRDYETDSVVPLPLWLPPLGLLIGMVVFSLDAIVLLLLVLAGRYRLADESADAV
jgi:TRAP-type C4-dicarboxylate transport system permease small subunit